MGKNIQNTGHQILVDTQAPDFPIANRVKIFTRPQPFYD